MKKLLFLLVFFAALSLQASPRRVTTLRAWPSIGLAKPLLTDTLNVKGKRIDLDRTLLASRVNLNAERAASKRIEADTAGWVMPSAAKGYALHVVQTALRADRFCRLKLTVKSPARIEVYVNDERKGDKQSVQDSLPRAGSVNVNLRMEPEQRYRVVVKMLQTPEAKLPPAVALNWEVEGDTTAVIACDPDLKQRVLLRQTAAGKSVSAQRLSPNGRWLLTTYSDVITPGRSNNYTVLTEVASGRVLATYARNAAVMGWMPASSRLWYRAPSEGGQALIAVDPATMQEERLAEGIREGSLRFAPDEKSFYTTENENIEGDAGPVHRVLSIADRSGGERGRSFVSRYDLATGLTERLTYGLRSSYLMDVSPDSRRLLIGQSSSTPQRWPFSTSTLLLMDASTLQCDTLFKDEPFVGSAAFSPDGRQVLIMGGPEAFGGIGKNCSEPIANDYDRQAFLMNLTTHRITPISRDFNPSLNFVTWNAADGCIYFTCDDADRVSAYRYRPSAAKFEKLPLQGDCVRSLSVAAHAPYLAYTGATASHAAIGYLASAKTGKTLRTFDPAAAQRADVEVGTINDWQFTASDGTVVTGYYCLPPDFDPARRYPLIVYYYGGTTPTTRSLTTPYSAQLFASRGYVALMLNPSGTIGFGQEFSARHVNAWGDYTANEIIEGTRRFAAEHASFVDSTRIGCLGASYGGFMTQYLQTKTQLFRCAVSHAGISNVTSYWGEGYWGVGYNAVAAAGRYPWSDPALFTRHGSLFNADKIHTPLLLLHGTADTNVPIGESIQLYNALKLLGRTVELIEVDGENHFISDYPKRELWHNTIMAWFARWLQDRPQWWDDLYPQKHLQ